MSQIYLVDKDIRELLLKKACGHQVLKILRLGNFWSRNYYGSLSRASESTATEYMNKKRS